MPIFYSDTASFGDLEVTGSAFFTGSDTVLVVKGSGSLVFGVSGSQGSMLEVRDVSTATEVFAVSSGSTDIFLIENNKRISMSGSVQITGSLSGQFTIPTASYSLTSSYVQNAISASFATTASFVNTLSQDRVQISGSLSVSGGLSLSGSIQVYSANNHYFAGPGAVGINNVSPAYELDVTGDARVTTSIGVGAILPSGTAGRIDASNDVVAFSSSDIRFKENVVEITDALEKLMSLRGVEFDWIPNQEHHGYEGHDVGVIAQEIEKVLPEIVSTRSSGYKAVKYEKIVVLLIQAIKEQQKQIEELKNKLK